MFGGNLLAPVVELTTVKLDHLAAVAADQVVVMAMTARPIGELSVRSADRIDVSLFGQPIEIAVDGREADRIELAVQLLRGQRFVALAQRRDDRGLLLGASCRRLTDNDSRFYYSCPSMMALIETFDTPFAQKALVAVLLVAAIGAAIGPMVVLRELQFFTHSVGSGAYPAIVMSFVVGIAATVGALVGAIVFAALVALIVRRAPAEGGGSGVDRRDAAIGVSIAAALALGAVLASTVGARDGRLAVPAEGLLFGSVLTVDAAALTVLAIVAILVVALSWLLGERWLATGFDPSSNTRSPFAEATLFAAIAIAVGASLPVTGALLAPALLVLPAATARVITSRVKTLVPATLAIAILEGVFGLYLALTFDLPTGAAIATLAGGTFVLAAVVSLVRRAPTVRAVAAASLLLVALVAAGCGSSEPANDEGEGTVRVVATTPQVADIVRHVGEDAIELDTILSPGTDAHGFEPRASDLAKLSDADVIFASGGDLDSWIAAAAKASGTDAETVTLSDHVRLIAGGHSHDEEHAEDDEDHAEDDHAEEDHAEEGFNAHWYLDPANVATATQTVRDELVKVSPPARETFRANADAYILEAEESGRFVRACVKKLPEDDRAVVTGHDDFAYLADASGIEVAAQLTDSGESEPSAKDVQNAVSEGREHDARSVVVSRGEVTQLARRVAESLDVPLLELYADSLATDNRAATLLGAVNYNVSAIAAAADKSIDCEGRL